MQAFLVDIFQGPYRGKTAIFASGRLESGESFGLIDDRLRPAFYIRRSDLEAVQALNCAREAAFEETEWSTLDGEPVVRMSLDHARALRQLNDELRSREIRTYEGDIDYTVAFRIAHSVKGLVEFEGHSAPSKHVDQLFINPKIKAAPSPLAIDLRVLALDIETNADATRLLGLSLVSWSLKGDSSRAREEVFIVGQASPEDPAGLKTFESEKDLLTAFRDHVVALDPDIITGWNVIDFDLAVLSKIAARYQVPLCLGRTRETSYLRTSRYYGNSKMIIQGRQVLDALQLVRHTLSRFEDHRLDTVAHALLGRGKTLAVEEWQDAAAVIMEAYESDRPAFTAYVLEDSRLVRDILRSQNLLELTLARSMLTSLPLAKAWGSIAPFETLYMGELHKRKRVAPSLGVDAGHTWGGSGGLVLEPKVGLHDHVLIFDFKSLYPSVMRTFNIDPLAFVQGEIKAKEGEQNLIQAPNGASFDRTAGILPELLKEFFNEREQAKRLGDANASYAYKIIMNSFYGVLGTDACRFADMRLADAITGFGQFLLTWMQTHFESLGLTVLYGDTDSLFVSVPELKGLEQTEVHAHGKALCRSANEKLARALMKTYGVDSYMELEFEKHYQTLFLPADRQGEGSRAKNYAGLLIEEKTHNEKLEITGLEAVRSDWTLLAQTLQRQLLTMIFHKVDPKSMLLHVQDLIQSMTSGKRDDELVYRKRIRKPLSSYTKTTPPAIKAARLLPRPVRVVRYLVTTNGPEPLGFITAPIDYAHYIAKQIRPIVEGLAPFAGFDADLACAAQGGFNRGFIFTETLN